MTTFERLSLVYERDYQWLVSYFDELGFVGPDNEVKSEGQMLIKHYTHCNKELSLMVTLNQGDGD